MYVIKSISIRKYKSYHPTTPTTIGFDTSKQATFIYGFNGAGKSAIGEVIHGVYVKDAAFQHCQVETTGIGPFRHLVYNHAFVARVIGETMPGIFTIGEIDTAKQKELEEKVAENNASQTELVSIEQRATTAQRLVDAEKTRGIDEVWKGHGLGKATKLAKLLEGYGRDKRKFFDELRQYATDDSTTLESMERLEERWADASSTESDKTFPSFNFTGFEGIENDPVWQEAVEISSTSTLAPLIKQLGNGDWVDQGRQYFKDDRCPFCQQNVPHNFEIELARLVEGSRQLKLEKIDALMSNYQLRFERLEESVSAAFIEPFVRGSSLASTWSHVRTRINANLVLMARKKTQPSQAVSIENVDMAELILSLASLKEKVFDFNQRISDRAAERSKIKTTFYQVLCADRADAYMTHAAALAPLEAQLNTEKAVVQAVEDRIKANEKRLTELRKSQSGVDASVDMINASLKGMGIDSFWIAKREGDGHLYCMARPNEADSSAHSLSEGEKTLISFLYFVESIRGTHEESGIVDVSKTVIVIDDPISSLSQNFIYDISTIIQHQLIKPPTGVTKVKQVIVLTHNLFFFHELVHQLSGSKLENASKKCQMLRVQKKEYSAIVPLDPTTFMNDYDALWQVLRDARADLAPVQVVPNTMRCILEQFFTFTTGIDDLDTALEKVATEDTSQKFRPLLRFLNRGSHKDGINGPPMDWSQYDIQYYLDKLRGLFSACGNEQHYLRKLGEVDADVIAS
jgi:wobble nucleotide-excising tRNase